MLYVRSPLCDVLGKVRCESSTALTPSGWLVQGTTPLVLPSSSFRFFPFRLCSTRFFSSLQSACSSTSTPIWTHKGILQEQSSGKRQESRRTTTFSEQKSNTLHNSQDHGPITTKGTRHLVGRPLDHPARFHRHIRLSPR